MKKTAVIIFGAALLTALGLIVPNLFGDVFAGNSTSIKLIVTSPLPNAIVNSPVHFAATASSSHKITGWRIYVDQKSVYLRNSAAKIDTAIPLAPGKHSIIIRAWNSVGAYNSYYQNLTVVNAAALSTNIPPTAVTPPGSTPGNNPSSPNPATQNFDSYPAGANISNDFANSAWNSCNCGGTGTVPAAENFSQSNGNAAFSISGAGSGVSGWLWWSPTKQPARDWIFDYDVQVSNPGNAAALEFDGNQTASASVPGNFVFGTECNYGFNPSQKTVWRFWTTASGHETWDTTGFACPITTADEYHVQMHFTVLSDASYQVDHVKVTNLTNGKVVEDDTNLGTFFSVGANTGHGNSIDVQLDAPGSKSFSAAYSNIKVVRW